jgi:uncharacterized protein YkwD
MIGSHCDGAVLSRVTVHDIAVQSSSIVYFTKMLNPLRPQTIEGNCSTMLSFEQLECRRLLAAVSLTNHEQLLLELINRGRAAPAAEVARYGVSLNQGLPAGTITTAPKQPLAPNQALINAARAHSQDMLDRNYFEHKHPQGDDFGTRIAKAGYRGESWGENIAMRYSTNPIDQTSNVLMAHETLVKSTKHRPILMDNIFDEVGTGVRNGTYRISGVSYNATTVTEDFGGSSNKVFITGVAYTDLIQRDNFYTVGEGMAGLTVVATAGSSRYETQTGPSGGYSLEVAAGTYTVTFSGGALAQPVSFSNVVVQSENRKVDLIPSQAVTLQLVLSPTTISENGGRSTGTVSRTGLNTSSLVVSLSSSDTTEASVPATVTIPAGNGSTTFAITAVNDTILDGDQSVTIRATASGASAASTVLTVTDDEKAALSLSLATNTISESGRSISATLSRNGSLTNSLLVNLSSNDTSEATVPATVTIPAGAASTTFTVIVVNDTIPDGSQSPTITASTSGYLNGTAVLTVADDDILTATEDQAITSMGTTVDIGVLANDKYPSSQLSDLTIRISTPPVSAQGIAQVVGKSVIRFTPATGFTGIATLHYVIHDPRIGDSQAARVRIGVPVTVKQNPWLKEDVDGDGRTTAFDALQIINLLNTPGSRLVGDLDNPLKPLYYDVNGDGRISALDVLWVINRLNERSSGEGEPRSSQSATDARLQAVDQALNQTWDWFDPESSELEFRRRRKQ